MTTTLIGITLFVVILLAGLAKKFGWSRPSLSMPSFSRLQIVWCAVLCILMFWYYRSYLVPTYGGGFDGLLQIIHPPEPGTGVETPKPNSGKEVVQAETTPQQANGLSKHTYKLAADGCVTTDEILGEYEFYSQGGKTIITPPKGKPWHDVPGITNPHRSTASGRYTVCKAPGSKATGVDVWN